MDGLRVLVGCDHELYAHLPGYHYPTDILGRAVWRGLELFVPGSVLTAIPGIVVVLYASPFIIAGFTRGALR